LSYSEANGFVMPGICISTFSVRPAKADIQYGVDTSGFPLSGLLKNVLQGVASGVPARRLYGFVLLPDRDAWQHQHQCFGGQL